jgi:hypothetical protein
MHRKCSVFVTVCVRRKNIFLEVTRNPVFLEKTALRLQEFSYDLCWVHKVSQSFFNNFNMAK